MSDPYDDLLDALETLANAVRRVQLVAKEPKTISEMDLPRHMQASAKPKPVREMRLPANRMQQSAAEVIPQGLTKTQYRILAALAQHRKPLHKKEIGIITGLSHNTGPFNTALADLKELGFIVGNHGVMTLTPPGVDAIGDGFTPLPTGLALLNYWRDKLGGTAAKIHTALKDRSLTKEHIGSVTLLSHNTGPFNTALANLKKMGMIRKSGFDFELTPEFRRALEPTIVAHYQGKSIKLNAHKGHVVE